MFRAVRFLPPFAAIIHADRISASLDLGGRNFARKSIKTARNFSGIFTGGKEFPGNVRPVQSHSGDQMDVSATTTMAATRPGKSAQSVGHMAKAAVAEARASGVDLPKNAQGMAASAIAKGADPASVFAALVVPPAPDSDAPGTPVTDEPVIDTPAPNGPDVVEDGVDPAVQAAQDGYDQAETATAPDPALPLSPEEAALMLLA